MDPNAAWRQWMDLFLHDNIPEAVEVAEGLIQWVQRGGFEPEDWVHRFDGKELKQHFYDWYEVFRDPEAT